MSELIKRREEIKNRFELDEKQQQENCSKRLRDFAKKKGRIETISVSMKRSRDFSHMQLESKLPVCYS